jgi:sugar phosphate isomerase/epimerase
MRIGCWVSADQARLAAELGYDFVELPVTELYPEGPTENYEKTKRAIESAGIPALVFNFFLPPTLRVVGAEVDSQRLTAYLGVTMDRAARLGAKTIVFGSGGARRVPEHFPRETAVRQFHDATRLAADEAQRHGLALALEPLNRTETNLIHTVEEAVEHAQVVDHPAVGVLADIYHMYMENEPFRNLFLAQDRLLHVHVCDAGRAIPGSRTFDLWGFFCFLNAMDYTGAVSTECNFTQFASEGGRALSFLREAVTFQGELAVSR